MSRPWLPLLLLCAVATIAAGCTTASEALPSCTEASDGPVSHRYVDLEDVDAELHSLDVYGAPTAQNCPVLVWVHGGAWRAGDKRSTATTVKADHFVADGFVFVSVNYRLASPNNDVRWPDFGVDVATAVSWVVDNAPEIGGDPTKVSVIGHSSGAHLASIIGTNPTLLDATGRDPADLRCVISLDSVAYDLTNEPPWETAIVDLAFPNTDARRDGSPTLQVREHPAIAESPQFLIVTRGRRQRIDSSQEFADAIRIGGGQAEVVDVSPYDHAEVNLQLGVQGESVITPVVDDFLLTCR